MHPHSLEAYREGIKQGFKTRSQLIFNCLWFDSKELSDREILHKLFVSDDLNKVRPRISEMLKEGILEECGVKREHGNPVRIVRVKQPVKQEAQGSLF